jgi:uncharacterized protein with FMN-binding domain
MRRIVLGLLATAIATSLLIGLKSPAAMSQLGVSAEAPADPASNGEPAVGQPDASLTPGAPGAPGASGGPSATATGPGVTPGPTTAAAGQPPATTGGTSTKPPATTPPKTTAAAPPASRTILGTAFAAGGFGNMQVKIIVTGTHIDDVVTVQKSNQPKDVATHWVNQILAAQSASVVGNVSGATFSSTAYKQSLQSAIAKI